MLNLFKKVSFFIVILILSGCVSNSHSQNSNKAGTENNKVTIGYTQFPANLDPTSEYNGWFSVRYGVTETLFKLNENLEVEPWLAESIEQVSPLEWKITLKDGISFHNGELMTADTVKASLENTIERSDRAAADLDIEDITVAENTVVIKTRKEQPVLANLLSEPYASIINTRSDSKGTAGPIGTGPYQLKSFTAESNAELEAYADYWAGEPSVATVVIKYFSDPNAISLALQSQEIDAVYGLPYANLATYRDNSDYSISEVSGSRFLTFIYNFDKPIMADISFRQAIDSIIDKQAYSESLFKGSATPASGPFPDNFSFALEDSNHKYDVEAAKEQLDKLGYKDTDNDGFREKDGSAIQLEILSYTRLPEIPLAVQALQQQLKEIGIDSKIKKVEDISAALKENTYDISPYTMVGAPVGDPYPYYQSTINSTGVANMGHYSNPEADQKIAQLAIEVDPEKRSELSKEIQSLVDNDYAFTFIGHFKVAIVMSDSVKGLESHPSDYYHVTNKLTKE